MSELVLDASVLVSAVSPTEVHHSIARRLFESHPEDSPFLVPSLFRIEVLSALARRGEPDELLETIDVLICGPRFHVVATDDALVEKAAQVVREARLRAYDAVYVALALNRTASLLTLDSEVPSKVSASFPNVRVIAPAR